MVVCPPGCQPIKVRKTRSDKGVKRGPRKSVPAKPPITFIVPKENITYQTPKKKKKRKVIKTQTGVKILKLAPRTKKSTMRNKTKTTNLIKQIGLPLSANIAANPISAATKIQTVARKKGSKVRLAKDMFNMKQADNFIYNGKMVFIKDMAKKMIKRKGTANRNPKTRFGDQL